MRRQAVRGRGRARQGGRAVEGHGHTGMREDDGPWVWQAAGRRTVVRGVMGVGGGRIGGWHAGGGGYVRDVTAVLPVDLGPKDGGHLVAAASAGGEVGGCVEVFPGGILEQADLLVVRKALRNTHGVALENIARVEPEGGALLEAIIQHA